MEKRIAYYAHHHGSGHLQHAIDLAETMECELLILSSLEFDATKYRRVSFVKLPKDVVEGYVQPQGTAFHYTPNNSKIQKRFHRIASTLKQFQPDVVMVDVSVEVASFVKLLGYPVIYRLMHGKRNDLAHRIAYKAADRVVAYYPRSIEQKDRKKWLVSRVSYVGMRGVTVNKEFARKDKSVCVMTSSGGDGVKFEDVIYACRQAPDWQWTILGTVSGYDSAQHQLPDNCTFQGFVKDPDIYLAQSSVIVSASGHNAVARSVSHNKPVILYSESRPFSEQYHFALSISDSTEIQYVHDWQKVDWAETLTQASRQDVDSTSLSLLSSDIEYRKNLLRVIESISK